MWPMIVDYTDDECKRLLRSLELEAYAAIINAFRAQGFLTKDKRKILQELCNVLSISMERHRAEIRRAVNDEHLNTVAERLYGANTSAEWSIEGRRVVPLMQRLAPQTVFTDIANSAANAQATKNASLPLPGRTGLREISNGIETMASRKRKDLPPDPSIPPNKLQAIECQYPHVQAFDSPDFQSMETSPCSETPTAEIHPATGNEISPEPTSLSDYISSKIPPMAHVPSLVSPVKSSTKHIMLKSSTVTTFSTFDQMPSNLLSSKPPSRSPLQSVSHEGHQASMAEMVKSLEPKSLQRSSSTGAMRTTVIPHTVPSTGLVRSARIINVTPPAGSRLPCSITPSAISALGLSSNLTTGALRVTLPAGTLNTSSSMRASAVAKPNVIVVHKAQMWPRSQAAVIMSSTPVQRIPESNSENAQKQEKNKLPSSSPQTATTTTVATKPQAKPLPSQSLNVSTVPIKGADTNTVRTPSPSPVQQTDSTSKEVPVPTNKNTPITQVSTKNQTSSLGSKNQITVGSKGQLSEIQCKKNLLADVIQESGLVLESTEKSLKEKGDLAKKDKEQPSKNTTTPGETLIKTVIDSTPISKTVTSIIKTIDTSSEVASLSDIRDSNILKRFEKGDDTMDSQETVITISTMEIPTKNTIKKSTDDSKEKNS
ncbi:BRCA2-interacting transcriptional repressor EMSY isoform X4 [Parasteatoda tepidariorum]|uniref:BRCA2-interacting transcriptional repressor EMSY isoform X4 n=1 Tax=Parasteatoda tepidariorum TaxID=114398 RepID=UPI0039BD2617